MARVPPRGRRRQLEDRRDGQGRRPLLLLQGDPEGRAHCCRAWFPLVGPELGYTNIVPVDFVAKAMDHIAHEDGLDGQAFHLAHPKPAALGRGAQHLRPRRPRAAARAAHRQAADRRAAQGRRSRWRCRCPRSRACAARSSPTSASPTRSSATSRCRRAVRHARHRARARRARASRCPPLETYTEKLWDYWERKLDPDLYKDRSFEGAVNGRTVVITGASSGIGRAAALKVAVAGGVPLLVARTMEKLEEVKAEIEEAGGTAYVYAADLSDLEAIDALVAQLLADHPRSTCSSTTRAARSAARSRSATTASTTTSARCSSTTSARSGS